jgi:group I intron endonuclease
MYNLKSWELYAIKLQNVDEYRYIGITSRGYEIRFKEHTTRALTEHFKYTPLNHWIRKHKEDKITCILLKGNISSLELANELEMQYIKEFKLKGHRLLNVTEGGGGNLGLPHTEDSKRKLSEAKSGNNHPYYGKTLPEEWRLNMSRSRKGKTSPKKGYKTPESVKLKLSESCKLATNTPEAKQRLKKASLKGVHVQHHKNKNVWKDDCEYCCVDK